MNGHDIFHFFSLWTVGIMEQGGWKKIGMYADTYFP